MREYVRRQQSTIAEFVMVWPVYKLCTGVKRMEVSSRYYGGETNNTALHRRSGRLVEI